MFYTPILLVLEHHIVDRVITGFPSADSNQIKIKDSCYIKNMEKELHLANGETITLNLQTEELPYQLKVYYDEVGELIPGFFRRPDDLYYGLDLFIDMTTYDILCDIVHRLQLAARDQLEIVLAVLNMAQNRKGITKQTGPATRAEVINRHTGQVIVSTAQNDGSPETNEI